MFSDSSFEIHSSENHDWLDTGDRNANHTLLLLHGMFGGLSNFDGLIRALDGSGYRIVVPAIPLYEMKRRELTVPALARWTADFADALELDRPVILGNSMGGHVALEYALRYPGRTRALVLTGSSGLMEKEFGQTFPRRNNREYIRQQASLTFYEDLVDDRMIDEIQEVVLDPRRLVRLLALARATRDHYMGDRLPEIDHPVLLVWGRQDRITPPEVADLFAELLPKADLKWIDRCGHAPMMERPVPFARHLTDFLTAIETQTPTIRLTQHEEDYTHI